MRRQDPMYELALVGCGRVAEKHIRALRHLRKRVVGILLVDPVPAARERIFDQMSAEQRHLARGYNTLEELFRERKPDIVAITTPSDSHYPLARLALENRCHLLIEKPMTLSLERAQDLIKLAEVEERKIAVGHIYRYFPLVNLLQHELAQGVHGRVLQANVTVQWGHGQDYYNLAAWRGKWKSDGGVLMNQCVHAVDLMQWLINSDYKTAQGHILQQTHRMEAEDYGFGLFNFENGAVLSLEGTTSTPPQAKSASFTLLAENLLLTASIKGKKLSFDIRDGEGKSMKWQYIKKLLSDFKDRGFLFSLRSAMNPHTGIYSDLFQSIEYERDPRASGIDGFNSVAAILGVYESATKNGVQVRIPDMSFTLEKMEGFFSHDSEKAKRGIDDEDGSDDASNKSSESKKTPLAPGSFLNPQKYKHPGTNNEF